MKALLLLAVVTACTGGDDRVDVLLRPSAPVTAAEGAAPRPTFLPRSALWTEAEARRVLDGVPLDAAALTFAGGTYSRGREWRGVDGWSCPIALRHWVTALPDRSLAAIRAAYEQAGYIERPAASPAVYLALSSVGDHMIRVRASRSGAGEHLLVIDVAQTGCVP